MIRNLTRKLRAYLSFFFNVREVNYKNKDLKVVREIYLKANKIKFTNNDKLTTHQLFSEKILEIIKKKNF